MSEDKKYRNISKKGDYTNDELDCALECLMESEEIKKNKELMKLVEKRADEKQGLIRTVQDIRKASYDLQGEPKSKSKMKSLSDLKNSRDAEEESD